MSNKKLIDWDKAPDGAQYFGSIAPTLRELFYKKVDGAWYFNHPETREWFRSMIGVDNPTSRMALNPAFVDDKPEQLTKDPAPTDQPYMPQVGEVCEVSHSCLRGGEWTRVEPLKSSEHDSNLWACHILGEYTMDDGCDLRWLSKFRQIKTEREKLYQEGVGVIEFSPLSKMDSFSWRDALEVLIDSGWKPEK